jgi:flagellar biosynthesis GTPase FlhF
VSGIIGKIIEFVLNNMFIAVIILGAIASWFGKAGSKNKSRDRQAAAPPASSRRQTSDQRIEEQADRYDPEPAPAVYRSSLNSNQEAETLAREREAEEARRLATERTALERRLRQAAAKKEREAQQAPAAALKPVVSAGRSFGPRFLARRVRSGITANKLQPG